MGLAEAALLAGIVDPVASVVCGNVVCVFTVTDSEKTVG